MLEAVDGLSWVGLIYLIKRFVVKTIKTAYMTWWRTGKVVPSKFTKNGLSITDLLSYFP